MDLTEQAPSPPLRHTGAVDLVERKSSGARHLGAREGRVLPDAARTARPARRAADWLDAGAGDAWFARRLRRQPAGWLRRSRAGTPTTRRATSSPSWSSTQTAWITSRNVRRRDSTRSSCWTCSSTSRTSRHSSREPCATSCTTTASSSSRCPPISRCPRRTTARFTTSAGIRPRAAAGPRARRALRRLGGGLFLSLLPARIGQLPRRTGATGPGSRHQGSGSGREGLS